MPVEQEPSSAAYYKAAETWAVDIERSRAASVRTAWTVAVVASLIAGLEAIALVALTPLKTVEPYTLLVDRETGYVEQLKPANRALITPDAALTKSMLAQYVIAREGFDINTLRGDYRKVALWTEGQERGRYIGSMQASNPASPLASLPRRTIVQAQIRSISSLAPDTSLVRFATVRTDFGGRSSAPLAWAAVVKYRFSNAAMTEADRLDNPLGFQVERYRRDPEVIASTTDVPPPTNVPQTGGATILSHGTPNPAGAGHAMTRRHVLILLCALPSVPGLAQGPQDDPRTTTVEYQAGHRWPINTVTGAGTLILLEHGDQVRSIEASDPQAIQVTATTSNDGVILSQARPVVSNMVSIKTAERSYDIELVSDANQPAPGVVVFVAAPPAIATSAPATRAPEPTNRSGVYRLGGDKKLWPLSVTDDGAKTYIEWDDGQDVPAVFAVDGSNQEQTINAYMRRGSFTIDRVYDRLIFRFDKLEASATRVVRRRGRG